VVISEHPEKVGQPATARVHEAHHLVDAERHEPIERLLSTSQTCRLQQRSLFAYLANLLAAKARGDPAPSLI